MEKQSKAFPVTRRSGEGSQGLSLPLSEAELSRCSEDNEFSHHPGPLPPCLLSLPANSVCPQETSSKGSMVSRK